MMDRPTRILMLGDDTELHSLLSEYLREAGFRIAWVRDGAAMDAWLASHSVDLLILDLTLPGDNPLALVRRLRRDSQIPIVLVSACSDHEGPIIGLEAGADDFLAKPFDPRELLARIRAVLRRRIPCPGEKGADRVKFGAYRLDRARRELTRNGQHVRLTSRDWDLLQILVEHPNRVLGRDWLLDLLKGYERSPFDRSVDVQVARLRAKIEPDAKHPSFIRTVWGKGYIFTPRGDA